MAWENIQVLDIQSEFLQPTQISNSLSNTGQIFIDWNGQNAESQSLTQLRNWIADGSNVSNNTTLYQDNVWHLYTESPSGAAYWNLCLDKNGQNIFTITIYWGAGTLLNLQICFCINRAIQKGIIIYGRRYIGEYNYYFAMSRTVKQDDNPNLLTDIYNFLIDATSLSSGAGSGYIGNSLLSNKKMVGYNVPTSSAEGTKTESVNDVSASAVSGKPKSGNGFARIKFLRNYIIELKAEAKNQFRLPITGEVPNLASGTAATYDSQTESYYFSSNGRYEYTSNLSRAIPSDVIQNAENIEFEMLAKVNSNSIGQSFDQQLELDVGDYSLLTIFGNGYDDGSSYRDIARIFYNRVTQHEWKRNAPFDDNVYQNDWHRVKVIWTLNNQKVVKIQCYVDDNLYAETTDNYQLTLTSANRIVLVGMDNTYIKEWRLKVT